MSTKEVKEKFYSLGITDARYNQYPLWATLIVAQEHIAAAAYLSGWRDQTGDNLRYYRDTRR
jgi:hypothetical protein